MKKKFFSKLLMVALVATVGAFSSCKDYDDDIADVRNNLTQKATELQKDYNDKIAAVNVTLEKLQTSYDNLSKALDQSNADLKSLIDEKYGKAVTEAKAYSDANLGKAKDAAAAAEAAAKAYAETQAAAAQSAAIAAAKEQVAAAKAELESALAKANELIATQGQSIANLIENDKTLTAAIQAAQARADQAYTLADKANTLAETNKTNLEKAAADITALQTALANLDGKVADKADVAKLQSDLAALQKQVSENVVNLSDYKENITKLTSDLGALKEDLAKQIGFLGENLTAVKKTAEDNVAAIDAIKKQLSELAEANTKAHEQIIASVSALSQTVESNKNAAADALKAAVNGVMAEIAASNKLIGDNTNAIASLTQTVQANKDAQDKINEAIKGDVAQNAKDIAANSKEIKRLNEIIPELEKTLKAYADKVAGEAAQAGKDAAAAAEATAKKYALDEIKKQADLDKEAWNKAIDIAVETLVKTYKLNALDELIKAAKEDAIASSKTYTDAQIADLAGKAQTMSDKALENAKTFAQNLNDILAQNLANNYTNTTDMQAQIEAAKNTAVAQAYVKVLNDLLRDQPDWFNQTDDKKLNELSPTVYEIAMKCVQEFGLSKDNAEELMNQILDAALVASKGTGTFDAEGNEIIEKGGKIMVLIEAAADKAAKDLADVNDALDARIADIETFLTTTSGEETLDATIKYWITDAALAKKADLDDVIAQLKGEKDGALKTIINDMKKASADNAADIQKIMASINKVTGMFAALLPSGEGETIDDQLSAYEKVMKALADKIAAMGEVVDNLDQKVMDAVNSNLGATLQSMITSINLYANIHQATSDTYYGDNKGDDVKWYNGYMGCDHELKFAYSIEKGRPDQDTWSYPQDYDMRGDYELGENSFTFEKGMFRTYDDAILVRVSPANADLAAVKDKIALINSLGNNIVADGIVEVTDVQRFEESGNGPITRAYGDNKLNTGLWLIKFKLVEGKIASDFKDAAFVTADKAGNYKKQIVYAVAVKNTDFKAEKDEEGNAVDDGIDRYVVSEFDLTLAQAGVSNSYDFNVNETPIAEIHNRYVRTDEAETGNTNWSDDIKEYPGKFSYELTWNTLGCYNWVEALKEDIEDPDKRTLIHDYYCCAECDNNNDDNDEICVPYLGATYVNWNPALELGECDEEMNAVDRAGHSISDGTRNTSGEDNRHMKPILEVDKTVTIDGEQWFEIKIDFDETNDCDEYTKIRGFYVTLDEDFSKESGTSEINAWTSYIYKNVAYYYVDGMEPYFEGSRNLKWKKSKNGDAITLQEGNHGVIYVKDANNVRGDIIGFRVHAVNVDGTFTDPDGRAFYVRFGKETIEHDLTFNIYPEDKDVDAKAVQDGNPIYTFNKDPENVDMRFFNIPVYDEGFVPSEEFEYVYTWVGTDNIIRGISKNSTKAYRSVDGSIYHFTNVDGKDIIEIGEANENKMKEYFSPESFFTFDFSENPEATVEDNDDNDWKVQSNDPIWPNRKANSVRVTAKAKAGDVPNFNRLIDNAEYKIRLTIYRKDKTTSSSTIYNIINITIKKNMPTESGLTVKTGQDGKLEGGVWKFYVRPLVDADLKRVAATGDNRPAPARRFADNEPTTGGSANNNAGDPWAITWNAWEDFATDYDAEGNPVNANQHLYRWGADVRPWTLDEMFNGIIYNKYEYNEDGTVKSVTPTVSQDFYFIFKGAGDFASAQKQDNPEGKIKAKANYSPEAVFDEAYKNSDAIVVFNPNVDEKVVATPEGSGKTVIIGYRMPYVHYSHINDNKTYTVLGGRIFRGISAQLDPEAEKEAFLAPKDKQKGTEGFLTDVLNEDFKLEAHELKSTDGKITALKAQYLCAIDNEFKFPKLNNKGNEVAYGKVIECQYNEQKAINIFGTEVTLDEGDMYKKFAPKATNYAETLFPTAWSSLPKLADLISSNYYKVDYSSLVAVTPDTNYKLSEWFDYYFAENETDGLEKKIDPKDPENNSKIKYFIVKPSRDGIRPALDQDYEGIQVKFNVYDVWHHGPKTITIQGLTIKMPKDQASRQAR